MPLAIRRQGRLLTDLDFSRAACAQDANTTEAFFPDFEDNASTTRAKYATAKAICQDCPIRMKCLQSALDKEEDYGVWGGADETMLRRARFVDINGRPMRDRASIVCPNCEDESHENLYAIENIKNTTDVGCLACGLSWNVRRSLDISNPNWGS